MTKTVDDLRNEIRVRVGRYERIESTGFTKEALAAICESVGADVPGAGRPGKSAMRAAISSEVADIDESRDQSRGFRKGELEAIASALRSEQE